MDDWFGSSRKQRAGVLKVPHKKSFCLHVKEGTCCRPLPPANF